MENTPTFKTIETYSNIVENNDFFVQYTNHQLQDHYDANFLSLKYNPSLPEFQLIEAMHLDYQQTIKQKHLHFHWSENTGIFVDVLNYLNKNNYEIGRQELMHYEPTHLTKLKGNQQVNIHLVTENTLDDFMFINYNEDLKHGMAYAKHKEKVYHYQFKLPHVNFLLATINHQPVGSLIVVSSELYLEIDNVLTVTAFRNQRIATSLIHYVMQEAFRENRSIVLVVDAEDTPKEMYKKMGFQTISSQIQVQKNLLK